MYQRAILPYLGCSLILRILGSLDFPSDAFADGQRFRILAIVDNFARECLALLPDTSLRSFRDPALVPRAAS